MNISIKSLIKLCLILLTGLIFNSCNKSTNFENKIFFAQGVKSKIIPLVISDGSGKVDLNLVSAMIAEKDINATVSFLGNDFLENYNKEYGTNFIGIPAEKVKTNIDNITILKGTAAANQLLSVTISDWDGYIDGAQYALPIQLISKGNADVLPNGEIVVLSINKVIDTSVANTSTGFSAKVKSIYGENKPLSNITIEGKFKLTRNLIVPGNWRSDIFYGFGMQFCVFTSGGMDIRIPSSAFIFDEKPPVLTSLNTWTHFAITYKDDYITLYVNGDQAGPSYKYSGLPVDGFEIGGFTNGVQLSEFRVWDEVRSRQQLKTFACAVDPATKGLLAYWKFNEGTGVEIKDYTSKKNNLTPTGSFTWTSGVKCPQ